MAGSWALLGYGMFSVIEKASGEWIGRLGPWRPAGEEGSWPGTEIGWGLIRSAWGKGYATEGATAAMDFAVDVLGWTDIIHMIEPRNVASRKVAEALGSKNRGPGKLPSPFENISIDVWGQTSEQWRARRTLN
ncbi:MAG: GNAT family N-acetyltransferase [Pseudomonadota bacterium]